MVKKTNILFFGYVLLYFTYRCFLAFFTVGGKEDEDIPSSMASQVKEVKKYSFNQYSNAPQLYMDKNPSDQQYHSTGHQQSSDHYPGSLQTSYSLSEQFSRDSGSPYQSQGSDRQFDHSATSSSSYSPVSSQPSQNTSASKGFNPAPTSIMQTVNASLPFPQTSQQGSRYGQGDQPGYQAQSSLLQPPPPPPSHYMGSDHSNGNAPPQDHYAPPTSYSQSFAPSHYDQNPIPTSQGYYQQNPPPPPPNYW